MFFSRSSLFFLSLSLPIAFLQAQAQAQQSCSNFATLDSSSTCACPPGITGSDCSSLSCGNPILPPRSRPALNTTLAGAGGSLGCSSQCTSGFTGPTCGICNSATACSQAIMASGSGAPDDVYCSAGAWTWTEGFVSCLAVNPTLQSVFPGTTYLTFQKTIDPTTSLSAPFGTNGTGQIQLLYAAASGNSTMTEQFYCKAGSCTQSNTTTTTQNSVNWACTSLECSCVPGTQFCGGGGGLDLTTVIAGLNGDLSVDCTADGSSCAFKQATLDNLFGQNGLSLSGCTFGECVSARTVNLLSSQLVASTGVSSAGLSPGVIGGLAVLGAIVLVIVGLIVIGWWGQKKAREGGSKGVLIDEKNHGGVGLRWRGIGYALPSESSGFFGVFRKISNRSKGGFSSGDEGRILLDGISGQVLPGQLCAILGPTGAGKSTLVDILAGKKKSGRVSGTVELLGKEGIEVTEKIKVGYVDQSDVLPAMSTVREALMFAAELKLEETVSKQAKSERVFQVLTSLGLLDVADSLIGSGDGRGKRGISGGERRRVSIGLELLAAPAILVLDEPTSGLDSVSAYKVVQVLKGLTNADAGRSTTVLATIHQPNSQIFHTFDTVVALAVGGRQVYSGPADQVVSHFKRKGLECPDTWNPADYLLELASDPPPSIIMAPPSPRDGDSSSDSKRQSRFDMSGAYDPFRPIRQRYRPVTVLFTQFEVLAGRELRNFKRDWTLVVMHNVVAIIVGLFVGGLYYKTGITIAGFQNRVGSLFFLGSLLMFSSLSALSNFTHVKPLFLRERGASYYSPVAWFLSRVVFDIVPLRVLPTILVSCIVYWMVGLAPHANHFFKYLLILIEFSIGVTMWNLFLAAAITEGGSAILVSAVLNLFQMAFAGFFVNLASIPAALRWLQYLAPLKYCLEALAVNEVSSGLLIKDDLQGVKIQISAALIMQTLFGFKPTAYYRDVLVLFAFILGFGILVVFAVIARLKELR